MEMHVYNISIPLDDYRYDYYKDFTHAYGTFEFDTKNTLIMWKFVKWGSEFCIGEHIVYDTFASYEGEGVKDVTVIAFKEEADAVTFKLMWA